MNPDAVVVLLLMAFALGVNGILIVFGSDKGGYSSDFGCGLLFAEAPDMLGFRPGCRDCDCSRYRA